MKNRKGSGTLPIDFFFDGIRTGKWEKEVINYRATVEKYGKNSEQAKSSKISAPAVTISGEFSERKAKGLIKHSGYIIADIDDVEDPDDLKAQLCEDRYVTAIFTSIGGHGLAVVFKIDPRRHLDAFNGISEYLFTQYSIVVDTSGKDVSRARFVSYDPEIYVNDAAAKFAIYPKPKPKALRKLPQIVFVQSDFEDIIKQIESRNIDLVEDYQMWLAVGFAFADHFGDVGVNYFHRISRIGQKYKYEDCERQFTSCRKHRGNGVTMATFYWLCKQAGIETISTQTKLIATTASQAKKGGRTPKDTMKLLKDMESIPESESADIIKQVFENDIDFKSDDSFIFELETWLRQNYDIRLNLITRRIEEGGKPMEQRELNSIFMEGKKIFDTSLSYDTFDRLIHSNFTPEFNPLLEWIESNKERRTIGNIDKLCQTIKTNMSDDYVKLFITKWLVGIIQSIHEEPSPLMLVLAGNIQNTGKTQWFRRLLPKSIRAYYSESKLDKGKDDEILMTQKLIIMDDEMAGKSKRNANILKDLTSKEWFSLREPYGRSNVDLRRLAVLAGTSNDTGLINDPTGNRRILPIYVQDIDKELYNSIDKTELLIEAYWLWKDDGLTADLNREQIQFLTDNTLDFQAVSVEKELIQAFFEPAGFDAGKFMTTTDIKVFIEKYSQQRLNLNKLGQELRNLGFEQTGANVNGRSKKGYRVIDLSSAYANVPDDELPF